jgi:hypothetical protein
VLADGSNDPASAFVNESGMTAMDRRTSAPEKIVPDKLKHLFSIASRVFISGPKRDVVGLIKRELPHEGFLTGDTFTLGNRRIRANAGPTYVDARKPGPPSLSNR